MSKKPLRVLTWNVLYRDLDARSAGIADVVESVDPDIVLLQETNRAHADELAEVLAMSMIGCGPDSTNSEPTSVPAILANTDRVSPVHDTGVTLTDEDKTFGVLHQFEVGGVELLAGSIHLRHTARAGRMALDPSYLAAVNGSRSVEAIADESIRESVEIRLRQIDELVGVAASRKVPVLLGGDFNFVPFGVEYRHFIQADYLDAWGAGPRLGSRDTILEHNPLVADGVGVFAEASAERLPGSAGVLDYTLDFQFAKDMSCAAAWIAGRPDPVSPIWHSDHLALVAEYATE